MFRTFENQPPSKNIEHFILNNKILIELLHCNLVKLNMQQNILQYILRHAISDILHTSYYNQNITENELYFMKVKRRILLIPFIFYLYWETLQFAKNKLHAVLLKYVGTYAKSKFVIESINMEYKRITQFHSDFPIYLPSSPKEKEEIRKKKVLIRLMLSKKVTPLFIACNFDV